MTSPVAQAAAKLHKENYTSSSSRWESHSNGPQPGNPASLDQHPAG